MSDEAGACPLDGYLTREDAGRDYGVVLTADLRVDAAATVAARQPR